MYPAPSTPPEPAPPDHHLLTPSSILRQLKENAAVSHSQSSLEEINCKNKKSNLSFQENNFANQLEILTQAADASGSKESLNTYDSGLFPKMMKFRF